MPSLENPLLMFMALFSLYSPLASVPSYFPIVRRVRRADQHRLAVGLFIHVAIFAMIAIWIGEPLLALLGLTTAALTVTGGIALIYVGVPLMRGTDKSHPPEAGHGGRREDDTLSWRSVVFMPVMFPLTVGGTTFAIMVSFRARARTFAEVIALSAAAVVYAAVTGLTVYIAGPLERRVSSRTRILLERIAGILLTAIAVSLLLSGCPEMVMETLHRLPRA